MAWKVLRKIIKIVLPAVIFLFLGWQVARDWPLVSGYLGTIKLHYLLFSLPIFVLIYPEGALCWWAILQKMGIKISLRNAIRIWIISNTSRYVPGKIWQYVGRLELARREAGIARSKTLFSLLLEIFLVLIAAGLVSFFVSPFIRFQNLNLSIAVYSLPALIILLHPRITGLALSLIAKTSNNKINIPFPLHFNDSLSIFPLYLLNFFLNGLALYLVTLSIYSAVSTSGVNLIFAFSGFYAFSWAVGFLSLLSPGGLGVTEITLSYLLSFLMPLSIASSITLLYRFLLTISELIIFAFVLKIRKEDK